MDSGPLSEPQIQSILALSYVPVRIEADEEGGAAVLERLRVESIPTIVVLRPDGTEVARVTGFVEAEALEAELRQAIASPGA